MYFSLKESNKTNLQALFAEEHDTCEKHPTRANVHYAFRWCFLVERQKSNAEATNMLWDKMMWKESSFTLPQHKASADLMMAQLSWYWLPLLFDAQETRCALAYYGNGTQNRPSFRFTLTGRGAIQEMRLKNDFSGPNCVGLLEKKKRQTGNVCSIKKE